MDKLNQFEGGENVSPKEIAGIRLVDTENPEDMRRMREMCDDPVVQGFVDDLKGMTDEDIKRWVKSYERGKVDDWEILFAVVGKSPYVKDEEVDQIQGFVNTYINLETRKRILQFENLVPDEAKNTQLVEIADARYSKSKPGQMSSGLRQVARRLRELKGPMFIAAFVKVSNYAGIKTLEDSCFELKGEVEIPGEEGKQHLYLLNWEKLDSRGRE